MSRRSSALTTTLTSAFSLGLFHFALAISTNLTLPALEHDHTPFIIGPYLLITNDGISPQTPGATPLLPAAHPGSFPVTSSHSYYTQTLEHDPPSHVYLARPCALLYYYPPFSAWQPYNDPSDVSHASHCSIYLPVLLRPLALLPYLATLPCSPPCPFSRCIETKKKITEAR